MTADKAIEVATTFRPKWSYAAALTRTKLPQFASLIPVLGYAVLWSDEFQRWIMHFDATLGEGLWFSPIERIYLLYIGSVLILVGLVVFWIFCPGPVRRHVDRKAYIDYVVDSLDANEFNVASEAVGKSFHPVVFQKGRPEVPPVLSSYHTICDRKFPVMSGACLTLLLVGAFVFLLPSLEVFCTVVMTLVA